MVRKCFDRLIRHIQAIFILNFLFAYMGYIEMEYFHVKQWNKF